MKQTIEKLFSRRTLRGTFGQAVRDSGWRQSDLDGQKSAQTLAGLGATRIYVNTFGVAYGHIDGVVVFCSKNSPVRINPDGSTIVDCRDWNPAGPNFVRVDKPSEE